MTLGSGKLPVAAAVDEVDVVDDDEREVVDVPFVFVFCRNVSGDLSGILNESEK